MREADKVVQRYEARRNRVVEAFRVELEILHRLQSLMIIAEQNVRTQQANEREIAELEIKRAAAETVGDNVRIAYKQAISKKRHISKNACSRTIFANRLQLLVDLRLVDERIEDIL